jgi:periplasmic divalent cation tolerance protein
VSDAKFDHQIVLTTCPNPEIADKIARVLVEEGLAACVNLLPAMQSIYTWRGKTETATEHLLLIKSITDRYPDIEARIRTLHPYELPEIIAIPVVHGLPDYLTWLNHPD